MTHDRNVCARTVALLEDQGRALLSGDLRALSDMPAQLEQALAILGLNPPPRADLARIVDLARKNAALIGAAQKGLAQVRSLRTSREGHGLTTYGPEGRRHAPSSMGRTLARG